MNWKETLNPYMSTGEATFYRRFLHILKHFLIVIVGGAFFTRIVSHSFLFDHLYNPDIICAILYAAFVLTCILTAEGKPSSPKDDTSAEKYQSAQHSSSLGLHPIANCPTGQERPAVSIDAASIVISPALHRALPLRGKSAAHSQSAQALLPTPFPRRFCAVKCFCCAKAFAQGQFTCPCAF